MKAKLIDNPTVKAVKEQPKHMSAKLDVTKNTISVKKGQSKHIGVKINTSNSGITPIAIKKEFIVISSLDAIDGGTF